MVVAIKVVPLPPAHVPEYLAYYGDHLSCFGEMQGSKGGCSAERMRRIGYFTETALRHPALCPAILPAD